MANKDPAVLFYTADFLAGSALMTMKERGQYITLLCLQREHGHMSLKEMERAAGKLTEDVKSKFVKDEDGKFFNVRMELEINKRDSFRQKQRDRVVKRWNDEKDCGGTPPGNTTVLPVGNGNGNKKTTQSSLRERKTKDAKSTSREEDFARFWDAYPRKDGKKEARKAFEKVAVSIDVLLSALSVQRKTEMWKKENGRFIPYPATWLNQARWEDEGVNPEQNDDARHDRERAAAVKENIGWMREYLEKTGGEDC